MECTQTHMPSFGYLCYFVLYTGLLLCLFRQRVRKVEPDLEMATSIDAMVAEMDKLNASYKEEVAKLNMELKVLAVEMDKMKRMDRQIEPLTEHEKLKWV